MRVKKVHNYKELSELMAEGLTDTEISNKTGINYNFVRKFRNSGKNVEDIERSPQQIACKYCSIEPGLLYRKIVTVLEGPIERRFKTVPMGWSE